MKLKVLGDNQTEIDLDEFIVLFSYNTPVAYQSKLTGQFFKTDKKWSTTTSKHINKWLDGRFAYDLPQEALDKIL